MKSKIGIIFSLILIGYASGNGPSLQMNKLGASGTGRQFTTLGYLFAQGDIPKGKTVSGRFASGTIIPLQVDAKATHADGSLRHAVLTLEALPSASATELVSLSASEPASVPASVQLAGLLASDYDATVSIEIGGVLFTASARSALQSKPDPSHWLTGPLVSEWMISVPLKNPAGEIHPHLSTRFSIRAYSGLRSIRTDITLENDWAFEANPQGFTYSVDISLGGKSMYKNALLKHTHHTRWRKVFWWGEALTLDAQPDMEYWFLTGSIPNYDRSLKIAESALAGLALGFEPMSNGNWTQYMPETGAHDDIGPVGRSSALYLLTLDPRAKSNVLANGGAGGSYQIHYRDKAKDMPVSIDDYPYMTLLGNPSDAQNPSTGKSEAFPAVTNGLEVFTPDDAHQPSIAYIPYLVTGDYFFLEELQFWANWNMVMANPGYREGKKGLLKWGQVRAQAWSMRTLGQAAYITPDSHPLKAYFVEKTKSNIDWYTRAYVGKVGVNSLGWLESGYALAYAPYGIAPWQDDFFTWAIGHLVALGFEEAKPLLEWKGKFVVGRLTSVGYCWLDAASYSLQVGSAETKTPFATFSELFLANFKNRVCSGLEMTGYPSSATGYGANMQPALAMAVDAGLPNATLAWATYQTRDPKQEYTLAPQWAIIPGGPNTGGTGIRKVLTNASPRRAVSVQRNTGPFGISILSPEGDGVRRYDIQGAMHQNAVGKIKAQP